MLPWLEKHRPIVVDDIVGNKAAIERLKVIAEQGNMPNIILSGPPGTGKTTSIMCLARQLLGAEHKEAILELNASDERGIDVVRNKIKSFAQKKVSLPQGRHKMVILDEADSMTGGAQQALRRTMELYAHSTRFAFACNNSNKLIEAVQSRCAVVRFARLGDEDVLERLQIVLQKEEVTWTEGGMEALVFTADGDMRQALNNAQSTHSGFGVIDEASVYKVCDRPHPVAVRSMLEACSKNDLAGGLEWMAKIHWEGYSTVDILRTTFRVLQNASGNPKSVLGMMGEGPLLNMLREVGMTQMRAIQGMDSYLQLNGMVASLCKLNA